MGARKVVCNLMLLILIIGAAIPMFYSLDLLNKWDEDQCFYTEFKVYCKSNLEANSWCCQDSYFCASARVYSNCQSFSSFGYAALMYAAAILTAIFISLYAVFGIIVSCDLQERSKDCFQAAYITVFGVMFWVGIYFQIVDSNKNLSIVMILIGSISIALLLMVYKCYDNGCCENRGSGGGRRAVVVFF